VEIRRFGPGHRRPGGPPGTQGVEGQVLLHDHRAVVSELAFGRYAMVSPHTNPTNSSLFIVISGAGFVQVGDERERVNHGEAVVWPAGVLHGAYTDGTEMRAIVVELTGDGEAPLLEADAHAETIEPDPSEVDAATDPAPVVETTAARGALAERQLLRDEYDSSEGEPW
jgi:quercetin dioxygenase-like cupin family protein